MKPVVLGLDSTSELVAENSTEDSSSKSSGSPNSLCSFLSFSMVDCYNDDDYNDNAIMSNYTVYNSNGDVLLCRL